MRQLGFTDKKMLKMLEEKIAADERNGLNVWGGVYGEGEQPPSTEKRYWEKWK